MAKNSTPRPSAALVLAKVRRLFPESERAEAIEVLDEYGTESHEKEPVRVRLAVLKLAGGDLKRLRHWVRAAKADYRDALAYAEYPGEMRAPPMSPDIAAIAKADREQYLAWLRDV